MATRKARLTIVDSLTKMPQWLINECACHKPVADEFQVLWPVLYIVLCNICIENVTCYGVATLLVIGIDWTVKFVHTLMLCTSPSEWTTVMTSRSFFCLKYQPL